MKLLGAAALATLIVLTVAAPRSVSGQTKVTDTPTPTPTSTPAALPAAADLVAAMRQAMLAQNTFHVSDDSSLALALGSAGETLRFRLIAFTSLKPFRLRETGTLRSTMKANGTTQSSTEALVARAVGTRVAIRLTPQKWTCGTVTSGSSPGKILSQFIGIGLRTGTTVGSETVNGIPVWHVHVDTSSKRVPALPRLSGIKPFPFSLELYISQVDSTLVRQSGTGSTTQQGMKITGKATENFDHYGELVHVTLPPACKQ